MGTVYKANDGSVFECNLYADSYGIKYAINTTSLPEVSAYPLRSLTTLGESFDIICRYYPNYSSADEAAELDDLDCLIDNECNEEKQEKLTSIWGSDREFWIQQRDNLYESLFKRAIECYKQQNNH